MTEHVDNAAKDGIEVPDRPPWKTVRDLLPYLWLKGRWDLRFYVLAAFICMVAFRVVGLALPFLYKGIVDGLAAERGIVFGLTLVPAAIIGLYFSLQMLALLASQGQQWLMIRVSEGLYRTLTTRAFDHVSHLSLRFHLQRRTSSIGRIITRGAHRADLLLNIAVFQLAPMVIEFGIVVALIKSGFGWNYVAVIFTSAIFYFGITALISEWRKKYQRAWIDADQEAYGHFFDAMTNMEAVKNFRNERHELGRYDGALAKLETASIRDDVSRMAYSSSQNSIYYLTTAMIMLMVAWDVQGGTLTVGDLVLIVGLLGQFYRPLEVFAFAFRNVREALIDSEKLLALLAMKPDIDDRPGAPDLRLTGGEVRFEDVSFSYDPERRILQGVSFTVAPGQKLAIVGQTGAGKSTIFKLLFRYFDVDQGRVLVDGQDIRDITQASLRDTVGIVPQETALFNETIAYNIEYGRPGATREEIIEAAKLAQLHEAVERMPDGYDTRVGERGLKLSGGEKQRVAIARVLLRNPRILVLDEATASLDTPTERDIQSALDHVARNRTTLVIAHRLSTIHNADQILVLHEGRIIERGTHRELLAMGRLYAEMWAHQLPPEED